MADMQGKTVVITGATSGIGEVAAIRLAEQGARIVHVARDPARAAATQNQLRRANPGVIHAMHIADLSLLSEMKRVSQEIATSEPKIDVLIPNAGAMFNRRTVTADGLEKTFALNHMGYFIPTLALLPNMVEGGRTPVLPASQLEAMGFSLVIFPGGVVRALARTAQEFYGVLASEGTTESFRARMFDFDGVNKLLGAADILARGKRYEGGDR